MKVKLRRLFGALGLAWIGGLAGAGAGVVVAPPLLIGITSVDRELRLIDPITGQSQAYLDTGIEGKVAGIASDLQGNIFVLTTFDPTLAPSGFVNSILQIDGATGIPQLVADFDSFCGQSVECTAKIFEGGLAHDPETGLFYGIQQEGGESGLLHLIAIDILSGDANLVGAVAGASDLSAITFGQQGELYLLDTGTQSLLEVDPSTAQVLDSVGLSTPLGVTAGMALDPVTGSIIVADGGGAPDGRTPSTDAFYALNPTTGELEIIGPGGIPDGYSGLTFLVPEPSAGLLLLVSSAFLALRRRNR